MFIVIAGRSGSCGGRGVDRSRHRREILRRLAALTTVHAKYIQTYMVLQTVPVAAFIPTLSLAAPGALYEQIMAGVHAAVANGQLQPGAALPSVRQLAAETRVSVITVKRAYEELEREGILYSRPGLGSFISDAAVECTRKTHRARAEALLTDARLEAERAGLKPSEIRALFLKHL